MRRALLLLWTLACAGPAPTPAVRATAPSDAPNVVIVLCDTLRADALGVYGATRPAVSPNVDAFAAGAVVFDRAITPNAWTVPAVASIFTASAPQTHRVLRFRPYRAVELETLAPSFITLAEVFQANGWATTALLKTGVITASHGFAQGFDRFERLTGDISSGRSGAQLTAAAARVIEGHDDAERPFFLYLHYMDPHTPYQPPPPLPDWAVSTESRLTGAHREVAALERGDRVATQADARHLRALYDAEVQTFDAAFGELLARLDAAPLKRETIVVLVADHGEQFGEHGGWLHSDLWPENVHVPWMVRGAGLPPGRVTGTASTVDLAPTLATLSGLPTPADWQGVSRVAAMRGGAMAGGPVFAEYAEQRSVWDGRWALVLPDGLDGAGRLFDVEADPGFVRDLAGERVDEVARLRAVIAAYEARAKVAGERVVGRRWKAVDGGTRELLRELGYLE